MPKTPPQDAEAVLSRLIEAVPGGVVHVAPDGAVLRANPSALAFLGYGYNTLTQRYTKDFDGQTWLESGEPCTVADFPVTQALVTGKAAGPATIGVQQPDGAVRWAVFRAVPVDGGGAIVTFLDITERRETEHRLRVSDRLASLGRLAAGVAHEVNNPLTWVTLSLERALVDPAPKPIIAEALSGLHRVATIVRDLGALSRSETPQAVPFNIHESIAQAVSLSGTEAQHRATLEVVPGTHVPPAFGLPSRAVQIVLNLILNALQAIEPGNHEQNHVVVRTTFEEGKVGVEVADTGPGMAPAVLKSALDPFFTTKGPSQGTGLGLAISHALAVAMDGDLVIESRVGTGTKARFRLPAASADAPVAGASSPLTPVPEPPGTLHVVVIDDEPQIGMLVTWALESHRVEVALNGGEGLALLHTSTPDLIICDLMMPEVTGMDVHAELTATRPELLPRLVFTTGGAYTAVARAFSERTDIRMLAKPFGVNQVRALLASAIGDA